MKRHPNLTRLRNFHKDVLKNFTLGIIKENKIQSDRHL